MGILRAVFHGCMTVLADHGINVTILGSAGGCPAHVSGGYHGNGLFGKTACFIDRAGSPREKLNLLCVGPTGILIFSTKIKDRLTEGFAIQQLSIAMLQQIVGEKEHRLHQKNLLLYFCLIKRAICAVESRKKPRLWIGTGAKPRLIRRLPFLPLDRLQLRYYRYTIRAERFLWFGNGTSVIDDFLRHIEATNGDEYLVEGLVVPAAVHFSGNERTPGSRIETYGTPLALKMLAQGIDDSGAVEIDLPRFLGGNGSVGGKRVVCVANHLFLLHEHSGIIGVTIDIDSVKLEQFEQRTAMSDQKDVGFQRAIGDVERTRIPRHLCPRITQYRFGS